MILWRDATEDDLPAVAALLAEDLLAAGTTGSAEDRLAAFRAMKAEGLNHLIVGERGGAVIATYQIAFLTCVGLGLSRRAQLEYVRVARSQRAQGVGRALMADVEARARAAGCTLMQLTSNRARKDAHRFYESRGFVASHVGFKKPL